MSRLRASSEESGADDIDTAYTRRGTAAAIRAAVSDVDGVRSASVTVARRKVTVNATTSARDKATAQSLREPVTAAVQEKLSRLHLQSVPTLNVRVQPRSR